MLYNTGMTFSDASLERARSLHERVIVLDSHCDTTQRLLQPDFDIASRNPDGHLDLPRMREGGMSGVFLAVYASGPLGPGAGLAAAREQLNRIETTITQHSDAASRAVVSEDVRKAKREGRIAILIGIEGGYLIEDSLDHLREFRQRGATYLTLTHSFHTTWADSSGVFESLQPMHGGLTPFGREVIRELNRLGMMVDVSHASDETVRDALKESCAPVVATHSSCRTVSPHRRNLSDEQIKAIAKSGGVVQINFAAPFVDPDFPRFSLERLKEWRSSPKRQKKPFIDYKSPLSVLVEHFEHAIRLVGPDHVGIGSDFDGVFALPQDMEDCSKLPNLTAALLERGHSEEDLTKVLGENVLRVMDACESVAQNLAPGKSGALDESRL